MKRFFFLSVGIALSAVTAFVSSASADITGTFVSAVDGGNSFQSSLVANGNPGGAFSDTTATSGLWHDRPGVFDIAGLPSPASGAYQGQNKTGATTFNEVATTLTGLSTGENYQIYLVYGINTDAASGNQHIDAGFTSGALTTFLEENGTDTGNALLAGGTWRADEQLIGTAMANGSGEIQVFVNATLDAERSVYNGLAFQVAPVPEPSSMALIGFGLAVAVCRRRR